jgi:hypothetical protein
MAARAILLLGFAAFLLPLTAYADLRTTLPPQNGGMASETPEQQANRARVEKKLKSIVIDRFIFTPHDLNSEEMMKYLTERSKELDPEHIGIKFITLNPYPPYKGAHDWGEGFSNLPLGEIVDYICGVANLQYRIEGNSVVFFRPPSPNQNSN